MGGIALDPKRLLKAQVVAAGQSSVEFKQLGTRFRPASTPKASKVYWRSGRAPMKSSAAFTWRGSAILKNWSSALEQWVWLRDRDETQLEPQLQVARALMRLGQHSDAVVEFRRLLQNAPDHAEARHHLAQLELELARQPSGSRTTSKANYSSRGLLPRVRIRRPAVSILLELTIPSAPGKWRSNNGHGSVIGMERNWSHTASGACAATIGTIRRLGS